MIKPMVDAIIELARMGVQAFVTTHDYFIQQCFDMATQYNTAGSKKMRCEFISLYHEDNRVKCETADRLHENIGESEHKTDVVKLQGYGGGFGYI